MLFPCAGFEYDLQSKLENINREQMPSTEKNQFLNIVILSQCFGQLAALSFSNGIMFNYFDSLDCSESSLIILLKIPNFAGMFLMLPIAFYADTYGKKVLGQWGNVIQVAGLGFLISAPFFEGMQIITLFVGVSVFAVGAALFNSSWFALLDPLMKPEERGTFFAKMRASWKGFGILFTFFAQYLLGVKGPTILTQILILVFFMMIIKMYFYHRIPELEKPDKEKRKSVKFFSELKLIFQNKKIYKFSAYRFTYPLLTGCIALLFNLYEKKFMNFTPADIVFMGNLMFIGGIGGLWLGAKMTKRFTEFQIFMICTSVITTCGLLFPLHAYLPVPELIYAGAVTFIFGCFSAALGIAYTSLMLSLLPQERKSLASAFFVGLSQLGIACSGIFAATFVKKDWGFVEQFAGFNNIYSIILLCSVIPLPIFTWLLTKNLKSEEAQISKMI